MERHFNEAIVKKLCRKPLSEPYRKEALTLVDISSTAMGSEAVFKTKLAEEAENLDHPVRPIIETVIREATFWDKNRPVVAEGTYQSKFANHVIKGTFAGLKMQDDL